MVKLIITEILIYLLFKKRFTAGLRQAYLLLPILLVFLRTNSKTDNAWG